MKRPPIIWLTQSLLILFALLLLSAFVLNVVVLLTHWGNELSIVRIMIVYAVWLSIVVLLAVAFWGLAKRKNYGRWLGVLSLLFFWGLIILIKLRRPSGPYQYYEYDNPAQLAGAVIIQVVLHGLILLLILRLAFSKSVREFFRKEASPVE
ncbi:MAG TPA: hypothetical protein VJU84_21625 [Pyrinomonadaceae bacterium]|nr:hypothetical protein [Pyrinomonadaceae bacterium]